MNKKAHIVFFAFLIGIYITTTIGMPVYLHYCMGELEEVSALVKKKVDCCEGEDENKTDDCCENQTLHIAYKADFISAKPLKAGISKAFVLLSFVYPKISIEKLNSFPGISTSDLLPDVPPNERNSDILSTSVLRI